MDSRSSAARRLSDPAGALARLEARAHQTFPALTQARAYTERELADRRAQLNGILCPPDASVVLFGSWARAELTSESDDDWAVLVESDASRPEVERLVVAAREVLGRGERKPGAQDVFGLAFTCDELVAQIGLDEDKNTNLTRRMLLLLESKPLLGTSAHEHHWRRVLGTYVSRGTKDYRPPRFLLNDLVRYWRTICVDFEGKHWQDADDPKWVTRNAKLRTSRKILFAGGLVPLLACGAVPRDEQGAFLHEHLAAVPTDRLAEAFLHFDDGAAVDAGVRGLGAYDRFIALMSRRDVREELRALSAESRSSSPLWREVRSLGDELQQSLISLLFGPALSPVSKQYAVF